MVAAVDLRHQTFAVAAVKIVHCDYGSMAMHSIAPEAPAAVVAGER